jgi:H+/Cl- antiporter ClcA
LVKRSSERPAGHEEASSGVSAFVRSRGAQANLRVVNEPPRPASATDGRRGVVAIRIVAAAAVVGVLAGLSAAVFLRGLDVVTALRWAHPWLPWLLPAGAALMFVVVDRLGGAAARGTALVLAPAATGQGAPVPRRLWLMALLGTWATHLLGGSAGREGTAVQMGGALADGLFVAGRDAFGLGDADRRRLLVAGVAGGFGAVFGTPLAAAVFALELCRDDRASARLPGFHAVPGLVLAAATAAFVGAPVGELVLHALGGSHGRWPAVPLVLPTVPLLAASAGLGLIAGLVAIAFLWLKARAADAVARFPSWGRGLVVGGFLVVYWQLRSTDEALGLSLPALERALAGAGDAAFVVDKVVMTAVTVGGGLIGGEVTPLFVVGATLGAALAPTLALPPTVAAVAAMAAVFGGAAWTPVALTCMAIELCGSGVLAPTAVAVLLATRVVRRSGLALYESRSAPTS